MRIKVGVRRPFNFCYLKLPKPKVNLSRLTKELYSIEVIGPNGFFLYLIAAEGFHLRYVSIAGHPVEVAGSLLFICQFFIAILQSNNEYINLITYQKNIFSSR